MEKNCLGGKEAKSVYNSCNSMVKIQMVHQVRFKALMAFQESLLTIEQNYTKPGLDSPFAETVLQYELERVYRVSTLIMFFAPYLLMNKLITFLVYPVFCIHQHLLIHRCWAFCPDTTTQRMEYQ